MLIPEALLQAQRLPYDVFDRSVDACSRGVLGLAPGPHEGSVPDTAPGNFGAAFDHGKIIFHGSSGDARRLMEAAARVASHGPMDKGGRGPPSDALEAASRTMVAYVRESHPPPEAVPPSPGATPGRAQDPETASRSVLEMDDGEKISVRRDHMAVVRRVAFGSPGSPTHDRPWLDRILSNPNDAEVLLQKGRDEGGKEANADTATQRRSLRRLKEAERSDMKYGLTRHPCRIQGEGCRGNLNEGCIRSAFTPASSSCASLHVASAMCPYAQYPSVCCVDYLSHGRCKRAELGCCPWFHGDPGSVSFQRLLAEFLVTDEGIEEGATARVVQQLRETSPLMGMILQTVVDLITVAIEENDMHSAFLGATESKGSTNPHRIEVLREILHSRRETRPCDSEVQSKWEEGEGEVYQWLNVLAVPAFSHSETKGMGGEDQRAWCLGLDISVVKCVLGSSTSETVPPDYHDLKHDCEDLPACSNNLLLRTHAAPAPDIHSVNRTSTLLPEDSFNNPKPSNKVNMEEICRLWSSFFALNAPIACTNVGEATQKPQYLRLSPLLTQWAVDTSAQQLWRSRHSAHTPEQDITTQKDTPSQLFEDAARYLLQCRVRDCEEFNLYFPSSSRGSSLPSAAELGRLRWAPLLLLQDCVRLEHISARDPQPRASHDTMPSEELEHTASLPSSLRDFGDEASAERGGRTSPSLDFFASSSSSFLDQTCNPVLPTSFMLDTLIEEFVNADWSTKKKGMEKGGARHAYHSGAVTSELTFAWHALHAVVLKLGLGLLHCMELTFATVVSTEIHGDPQNTSSAVVAQLLLSHNSRDGSTAGLFTFVQTALLHLGLALSTALGERYERPLLDSVGWTPWTEQSMFADEFKRSLFTAAGFARHHQPVVVFSFMNSLLNGLLLVVLQRAERMHMLHEHSPVRRLLSLDPLDSTKGSKGGEATLGFKHQAEVLGRVHLQRLHSRRSMSHSLRPYISASLGIWSSLHDHSQRVLAARGQAMKEFRTIRAEFDAERSRKAQVRTRKYGGSPVEVGEGYQDTLPIIDLLLPHGSAALCAAAISRLLALLREGGSPYKSLRFAASIIYSARMLRHAAKQPRPQYVQSTKTVHRMTRSRETNRKHVTKVRVPVVKLVSSAHDAWDKEGKKRGHRAVKPIGLCYVLDEEVVHETLRVGLHMKKSGLKLTDGIRDDCAKGALIDYAEGRCLPAPTPELVEAYLSWRSRRELPRHAALSVTPYLLQVLGLRAHRREEWKGSQLLEVDPPVYSRRIPPTALLLEILAAHTDPEDVDRHQACLTLLQQDIHRFGTAEVCFAIQYRLVCRRPALGLSVMHRLWVYAITGASAPWGLPLKKDAAAIIKGCGSVHGRNSSVDANEQALLWSKLRCIAEEDLESYGELWSTMGNKKFQAKTVSNTTPATVQELKEYLQGEGRRSAASSSQLRASPKATPPSYENLIHQNWLSCQPNEWHRVQLVWSLCAATLLGLSPSQLEAAHENRRLAAQCLFYCFVAALPLGMNAQRDKTVQVLLLSGLLSDEASGHAARERGAERSVACGDNERRAVEERPLSRGCDGLMLSSAHALRVRGLRTFLAAQQQLAMRLLDQCQQGGDLGAVGQGWVPAAWQEILLAELKDFLLPCQKGIAAKAVPLPVWQLFQALLAQPSLALAWVEHTLLSPSDALLMWLVVHVDYQDQELKALIQWLEALPRPTATARVVLAQCKKEHAELKHNDRYLKKSFTNSLIRSHR